MKLKNAIRFISFCFSVYIVWRLWKDKKELDERRTQDILQNNIYILQSPNNPPNSQAAVTTTIDLVKVVSSPYSVVSTDSQRELLVTNNSTLSFNQNGVYKVTVMSDAVPFMNGTTLFATKEYGVYYVTVTNGIATIIP
jgi:hypothetical protein